MVAVGVPVSYTLPLSLFEGFVAEFIPAVGTYKTYVTRIYRKLGVSSRSAAITHATDLGLVELP